jgi:hypothetical protein
MVRVQGGDFIIWKILMFTILLGIGILLSVITYKLEKSTYVTNITTVYIQNNTIINITSEVNTTQDKPKISLPSFGEDVSAKVVT